MGWKDGIPVETASASGKQPAWMQGTPVDKSLQIPDSQAIAAPETKQAGPIDDLIGAGESLATLGSGAIGGLVGNIAGLGKSLFSGKLGTQEGVREGEQTAKAVSEAMTYQPRTEAGKRNVETIGGALDASKLAGLNPATAAEVAAVSQPASAFAKSGVNAAKNAISDLAKPAEKPMAGMGAASTAEETLRRERAANARVPLKLTKGDATRDFEQQRFEKETMKDSATGGPLRENAADNVVKIAQNFEAFADDLGATAPNRIAVGRAITDPLMKKMESAKAEISNAYTKARKAGDMQQPVSVTPIIDYLANNEAAAGNAGVLSAAERQLKKIAIPDEKTGELVVSINDLEEVRKMIGVAGQKDATNGHYAGELKGIIDPILDSGGGELYKKARGMYKDFAEEFKNQGAVKKLVTNKRGTSDRAVALEDVFDSTVLGGTNKGLSDVIRSLEKAGPEGLQGIKELKGWTIKHIQEETFKNASKDINGNAVPSYAKIKGLVNHLDGEGKLDLLFGKKGAAELRDLKELIGDVQTAPPGALNMSTTAAVLKEAMLAMATGRVPTAVAKGIAGIKSAVGDRAAMKRVREALEQPGEDAPIRTIH